MVNSEQRKGTKLNTKNCYVIVRSVLKLEKVKQSTQPMF